MATLFHRLTHLPLPGFDPALPHSRHNPRARDLPRSSNRPRSVQSTRLSTEVYKNIIHDTEGQSADDDSGESTPLRITLQPSQRTVTCSSLQVVGHGSFGVVFSTTFIETDEHVAIKKILHHPCSTNRELALLRAIPKHPNIIALHGYYYERDTHNNSRSFLNLVLDHVPCSLARRLSVLRVTKHEMQELEARVYSYQLCQGLAHLHDTVHVVHRDIKPQNLLVDPRTWQLKIADLGSAKIINIGERNVPYICSRYYRAPELLLGSQRYCEKIDLWSAGCVIAEMHKLVPLFKGKDTMAQLTEIIKVLGVPTTSEIRSMVKCCEVNKFPKLRPLELHVVLKDVCMEDTLCMLKKMLSYDPDTRPTAKDVVQSEYFDILRDCSTVSKQRYRERIKALLLN
ncbi:hypothetical protein TBLA_0B09215 [Henningerozyma blattae CBS 6284]|uniref:Protein kinase domain-containing protein n=1 Tax=Henningerozyma blattae (strain ATCC 34711 / CBS 6284 / DSM 70876 / NBRC 10599 / NRRL Y-10934 / UCD 77-7) TaxID=1071380 RepID=I2H036_HENB6|nr:hypothetical protein TBLA_0B09215 [Tetrapisispora blattae CBS 6284]CCH59738.1 hypothetical protein TBLA_0B09215 [Tetrapisispora blattae CBS 6284]